MAKRPVPLICLFPYNSFCAVVLSSAQDRFGRSFKRDGFLILALPSSVSMFQTNCFESAECASSFPNPLFHDYCLHVPKLLSTSEAETGPRQARQSRLTLMTRLICSSFNARSLLWRSEVVIIKGARCGEDISDTREASKMHSSSQHKINYRAKAK